MQQALKRLGVTVLFGLALALGSIQLPQVTTQPQPVQVADPGNGMTGNG